MNFISKRAEDYGHGQPDPALTRSEFYERAKQRQVDNGAEQVTPTPGTENGFGDFYDGIEKPARNGRPAIPAILPDRLSNQPAVPLRVGTMPDTRVFATVPWAMKVDVDGACWIDTDTFVYDKPKGTAMMGVRRGVDGYQVFYSGDYRWERSSPNEMVIGKSSYEPVVGVYENPNWTLRAPNQQGPRQPGTGE